MVASFVMPRGRSVVATNGPAHLAIEAVGAAMEPKELKTAAELEAMILAELNNPRVKVLVAPDPASGWHATTSAWGVMNVAVFMKAQQIAERLRAQYNLKIEPPSIDLPM